MIIKEFKFDLEDKVFYIKNAAVTFSIITGISYTKKGNGKETKYYDLSNEVSSYDERYLFGTKEELLASL